MFETNGCGCAPRTTKMSAPTSVPLSASNARSFVDSTDTFIFDCDGVLWKTHHLLPGVAETMDMLRAKGKKLFFVTNNSTLSREAYQHKLTKMGVKAHKDEIYCSAYAAAAYLESQKFHRKVYVIGGAGIFEELREAHIDIFDNNPHNGSHTWEEIEAIKPDPQIGAVVCGFDINTNYFKAAYAYRCIRENENCEFIATNLDSTFPAHSSILPGGGATTSPLITALGRQPTVLGKPEPLLLDIIVNQHHLDRSRTCMVGDRLETDILFGVRGTLKTLLVFTGISSKEDLSSPSNDIHPTFVLESLGDLHQLYQHSQH